MSTFRLTLKTLSPLHIGSGEELRLAFDFMVHDKLTWRLDEDAVLQAKAAQLRPGRDRRYPLVGALLTPDDYKNMALFRYRLRGTPRSRKADAIIQACIKDPYDRPYIPGSSLKGALRTALAWKGWDEVKPRLDRSAIGNRRSWAGKPLEGRLFGRDPNHDLLRALQVSDLHGPQKAGQGLALVNAQVLTKGALGSPIELEALVGGQEFNGSLKIDESLFSPQAERSLHFNSRRHWLDELLPRVQAHSQARIHKLLAWYQAARGAEKVAAFYRQLAKISLPSNQALVQVGWGSGWDGKTFWTHLQADKFLFEKLIRDFRMQKSNRRAPRRQPGDPFPTSRRVVTLGSGDATKVAAPFGWALLEKDPQS